MENMLQIQKITILGFLIASIVGICNCRPVGFSYAKFSGPVSGPEREIYVKDKHGHSHVDYIQKPDYSFAYGVDDPKSRVLQNRKESRHGDAVKGEYSVVDPDGTLRVVKYTADKKNGFQAEVITDGKSQTHGHDVAQQQHHAQYHPPPPPPPPQHTPYQESHQEHDDYYGHQEQPETHYHQNDSGPQTAAYTSHTRHPPPPPPNTQYHQGEYSGEDEEEDEYDDGGESGEEDDGSGEDDDEEEEEDEY